MQDIRIFPKTPSLLLVATIFRKEFLGDVHLLSVMMRIEK